MHTFSLTETVDSWTAQAVMASGYLIRLYHFLGDDRQAYLTTQACGPCEERAQRLGLQDQITALKAVFVSEHSEETLGEENAWQMMIEAHAGLFALQCLVEDRGKDVSLPGGKTDNNRAFHVALRSYRTAFPEEITIPVIRQAIETAATQCADAFPINANGVTDQEKVDLRLEIHNITLEVLLKESGSTEPETTV